jgi:uncharacterized membrane protein
MAVADKISFDRDTISENIEAILKLEEDDERQLSALHRASHKVGWFVGTVYCVILQAVFVLTWLIWNCWSSQPFDPFPFPLLAGILALEAVFLTSFVLIRQNSMDLQSERRNHLDLQINLLAEKEATSILRALSEIAKHLKIDLSMEADSPELRKEQRSRELRAICDRKRRTIRKASIEHSTFQSCQMLVGRDRYPAEPQKISRVMCAPDGEIIDPSQSPFSSATFQA